MRWISSIGGIIATGAAIAVLVSLSTVTPPPDAASSPVEETTSTELPVERVVVEEPVELDLSVPDLAEGLTDVLAEGGYTQFLGATELSETLSDDVVQVLIREAAVLVIPSGEER
jgi:hypothetical protein